MRFGAVLVLGLFFAAGLSSGSFTYLGFMNGTNYDDNGDSYRFSYPSGILEIGGRLYVADLGKNSLFIMNASVYGNGSTNISPRLRTLKSSGEYTPLENPMRMAYENGTLYIADGSSTVVKSYPGDGLQTEEWNRRAGSNLQKPSGVAFDGQNAYITDMGQGRLYIYSRATRSYARMGIDKGLSDGKLEAPADIEFYKDRVLVSDQGKKLIYVYDRNFTFQYVIGRGIGGITLTSPRGMEVYGDRIYVADTTSNRVVVFTIDGYPVDVLDASVPGGNLSGPEDIAVSGNRLYVADSLNQIVRVYEINETRGNDTVLSVMLQANQSIIALRSLQSAAQRLNLSMPFSEQPLVDLLTAQSEYDHYIFASASALAEKALREANAAQANLSQGVDVKVRQIIKAEQDRVAPYRRQDLEPMLSGKLIHFDNTASDAKIKLSSKSYDAAIDLAQSLSALSDEYISGVEGKEKKDKELTENRTTSQFGQGLTFLYSRLEKLKSQAERYFQTANLTNTEALLSAANFSIAAGDYDSANRSMALAEFEISSYEGTLGAAVVEIDSALSNISIIEFGVNASAAKSMLLPPDLSPERQQLASAREIAYTNPQLAVAMANRASSSAMSKAAEAQTVSVAASAVLVMVGLMAVIALAFAIHLFTRRRRARRHGEHEEGEEERGHPHAHHETDAAEKPKRQHIWREDGD